LAVQRRVVEALGCRVSWFADERAVVSIEAWVSPVFDRVDRAAHAKGARDNSSYDDLRVRLT
jgi:hypothetical protein